MGWSLREECVFVQDDGSVLVYDLFGELIRHFSMGPETKAIKLAQAKVFQVISHSRIICLFTPLNI